MKRRLGGGFQSGCPSELDLPPYAFGVGEAPPNGAVHTLMGHRVCVAIGVEGGVKRGLKALANPE